MNIFVKSSITLKFSSIVPFLLSTHASICTVIDDTAASQLQMDPQTWIVKSTGEYFICKNFYYSYISFSCILLSTLTLATVPVIESNHW